MAKQAHNDPATGQNGFHSHSGLRPKKENGEPTETVFSPSQCEEQSDPWKKFQGALSKNMIGCRSAQRSGKKGNWTSDEDEILLEWVNGNGATKWTECSKLIRGRCGKQCRERWVNILNPDVKKGNWTDEEQVLIFDNLHKYFTSWSAMSKVLPGRTENSIKNYFYSSVRRLKSNPIIQFLRELHITKRVSPHQLNENRNFLTNEIAKLNRLSQEICKYFLNIDAPESDFRKFLLSVLFLEDDEPLTPPSQSPIGIPPSSLVIPRVQASLPHSRDETKAAFELLKQFLRDKGGGAVNGVIQGIEAKIDEEKPSRAAPTLVTVKIPYCWNCHRLECAEHGRTA